MDKIASAARRVSRSLSPGRKATQRKNATNNDVSVDSKHSPKQARRGLKKHFVGGTTGSDSDVEQPKVKRTTSIGSTKTSSSTSRIIKKKRFSSGDGSEDDNTDHRAQSARHVSESQSTRQVSRSLSPVTRRATLKKHKPMNSHLGESEHATKPTRRGLKKQYVVGDEKKELKRTASLGSAPNHKSSRRTASLRIAPTNHKPRSSSSLIKKEKITSGNASTNSGKASSSQSARQITNRSASPGRIPHQKKHKPRNDNLEGSQHLVKSVSSSRRGIQKYFVNEGGDNNTTKAKRPLYKSTSCLMEKKKVPGDNGSTVRGRKSLSLPSRQVSTSRSLSPADSKTSEKKKRKPRDVMGGSQRSLNSANNSRRVVKKSHFAGFDNGSTLKSVSLDAAAVPKSKSTGCILKNKKAPDQENRSMRILSGTESTAKEGRSLFPIKKVRTATNDPLGGTEHSTMSVRAGHQKHDVDVNVARAKVAMQVSTGSHVPKKKSLENRCVIVKKSSSDDGSKTGSSRLITKTTDEGESISSLSPIQEKTQSRPNVSNSSKELPEELSLGDYLDSIEPMESNNDTSPKKENVPTAGESTSQEGKTAISLDNGKAVLDLRMAVVQAKEKLLAAEVAAFEKERDNIVDLKMTALQKREESFAAERVAFEEERAAFAKEREAAVAERMATVQDLPALLEKERAAFQKEREFHASERESLQLHLNTEKQKNEDYQQVLNILSTQLDSTGRVQLPHDSHLLRLSGLSNSYSELVTDDTMFMDDADDDDDDDEEENESMNDDDDEEENEDSFSLDSSLHSSVFVPK
jgi:hypothetical protein